MVLEGIEKAERNVLPILNNLLENREMQLEDGRFLVAADRYDKLLQVYIGSKYGKCSKFLNIFLFSNKMLVIKTGIHRMLVRIANREDPDQTASSEAV